MEEELGLVSGCDVYVNGLVFCQTQINFICFCSLWKGSYIGTTKWLRGATGWRILILKISVVNKYLLLIGLL